MFWKLQLYTKHIQSRLLFTRLAYEGGAPDCSALLLLDSCLDSRVESIMNIPILTHHQL